MAIGFRLLNKELRQKKLSLAYSTMEMSQLTTDSFGLHTKIIIARKVSVLFSIMVGGLREETLTSICQFALECPNCHGNLMNP